jgi:cold shock CspA family protein
MRGTIKFYDERKGFGFIVADNGFQFFLGSHAVGDVMVEPGAYVEFTPKNDGTGRRPSATELRVLSRTPNTAR